MGDANVFVSETTNYPFDEVISLAVNVDRESNFSLCVCGDLFSIFDKF